MSWRSLGLATLIAAAGTGGCVGEPVDGSADDPTSDATGDATGDPTGDPAAGAPTPIERDPSALGGGAAAEPSGTDFPPPAAPGRPPSGSPADGAPDLASPEPVATPPASMPSPAVAVDCLATLPCEVGPADGGWAISLASTRDGESPDAPAPRVGFELSALTRDIEIALSTESGLTVDGRREFASSAELGTAGAARRALVPGRAAAGLMSFDSSAAPLPDVVERVTLVLEEAGTVTTLDFENVPWPSDAAAAVDCANVLPCTWTSADGALVASVHAIGLVRWHHSTRLVLDWSATVDRTGSLSLADAARAVTDGGRSLEYYGIDFGDTTSRGEGALSTPVTPEAPVTGRVVFRRAPPETAASLTNASFELSRTGGIADGRWRIELRNLPLDR